MKCKQIMETIEKGYPPSAALSFDNVGLLAGSAEKEIRRVYLALDATTQVIEHAAKWGADMLVSHHPLIFSPLKRVTEEDFIGSRIIRLVRGDISYYAMHTNYDVMGMARLSGNVLGLLDTRALDVTMSGEGGVEEGIGRVGTLPKEMTLRECCGYVKHKLKLETVNVYGNLDLRVGRLAISPGSAKSAIRPAIEKGAQVLVGGDIGHHDGVDAWERGLAVIDAGHYGTEYMFLEDMERFLRERLDGVEIKAEPVGFPCRVL